MASFQSQLGCRVTSGTEPERRLTRIGITSSIGQ
jgi:hypothetical protein